MKLSAFEKVVLVLVLGFVVLILFGDPPKSKQPQPQPVEDVSATIRYPRGTVHSIKMKDGEVVPSITTNPGAATNDTSYGFVSWSNPSDVIEDDAAAATISNNDSASHYLKTTSYIFSIDDLMIIDGVEVHVDGKCTGGCQASSVKLVFSGAPTGSDEVHGAGWTGSYVTYTYGGPTNKWGQTDIYPMQVNDSGFGCAFSAAMSDVVDTVSIEQIRMSIYYHFEEDGVHDGTAANPASKWWFAAMKKLQYPLFNRPLFERPEIWQPSPVFMADGGKRIIRCRQTRVMDFSKLGNR